MVRYFNIFCIFNSWRYFIIFYNSNIWRNFNIFRYFRNVWIFQIFLLFFNVSFLDKCTGNLDESQEQEPPKQPQEASEAAEDLSVYEEMYRRGEWSCFMCSKWFGRKDVLRQHLVLHYKKQLGKQFVSKENNPEKNICGLCQFQAKDPKALIQHIALGTPKNSISNIFRVLGHFKWFPNFRNFW